MQRVPWGARLAQPWHRPALELGTSLGPEPPASRPECSSSSLSAEEQPTQCQFIITVPRCSLLYGASHMLCLSNIEKSSCSILQKLEIKETSCAPPRKASALILTPATPGAGGKGRRNKSTCVLQQGAGLRPPALPSLAALTFLLLVLSTSKTNWSFLRTTWGSY